MISYKLYDIIHDWRLLGSNYIYIIGLAPGYDNYIVLAICTFITIIIIIIFLFLYTYNISNPGGSRKRADMHQWKGKTAEPSKLH